MKTRFGLDTSEDLFHTIRWINWIGFLGIAILIWFIIQDPVERFVLVVLTLSALAYNYILFYRLLSSHYSQSRYSYFAAFGAVLIGTGFYLLLEPYGFRFEILYILIVCSAGILTGRGAAISTAILAVTLYTISFVIKHQPLSVNSLYAGVQVLILLVSGYWISLLSGALHENLKLSSSRNNYLSLLLKVGTIATQYAELSGILIRISKTIAINLPVTYCAIFLKHLHEDRLQIVGSYPLRPAEKWQRLEHKNIYIDDIPQLSDFLKTGEHLVLGKNDLVDPANAGIVNTFAFTDTKTMGLFPLISKGNCLGLITLVEVRRWQREPFTEEKVNLLKTLSTQIGSAIDNALLLKEAKSRADRMAVLNEVSKAISSTIELDSLFELIHTQLDRVIPTDTYYVALYDLEDNILNIQLLIDNKKRYAPTQIPLREGLAAWVIRNRQPLLIHHLSQEMEQLKIQPIVMGSDQLSESWLGVPMLIGERVLGILAVASYSTYAFHEDDLKLLTSIAAQAALNIDNARQYAAVKEQARRDSLTGAFNHAAFLEMLDNALIDAENLQTPLSLVMIDVDEFKRYNDTYGHQMGDEVLIQIVTQMQNAIPTNSFIGRWGGEEFSIALPGSSLQEAEKIAENICRELNSLQIVDNNGCIIPPPTVSQGIATFLIHAQSRIELISFADAALYKAKLAGRRRIVLAQPEIKAPSAH